MSSALAEMFGFMNEINNLINMLNTDQAQKIKQFIFEIDSVLGLIKPIYRQYQEKINKLLENKAIKSLMAKRAELRKNKDYQAADKIRKELVKRGIVINDAEKGYKVRLTEIL